MAVVIGLRLLMVGSLMAGASGQAFAETDQRCVKGDDIRRIEIRFADAAGNLPCKVIYRPESESDNVGIVSWQDLPTVAACTAQAEEVVQRLAVEGWACSLDLQDASIEDDPKLLTSEFEAEIDTAEVDQADATVLEAQSADIVELPFAATDDATESVNLPDSDTETGFQLEEFDEPATLIDNPDIPAPSDQLVALIEDNLEELDTTLDGILEAKVVGYGDMNEDDIEDALTMFTFESPQPAYRQFLAVYAFDGETYQLIATEPVGGRVSATMDARVEAIDRGVVHLVLEAFEPGDAACCPSGTRRLALTLRELDLVEIDADVPSR